MTSEGCAISDSAAVRYSAVGGVATLTMDQPDNRNALTAALLDGLAGGLDAALADRAVRAVVLTNTGPAFCAGADLSGSGSTAPPNTAPAFRVGADLSGSGSTAPPNTGPAFCAGADLSGGESTAPPRSGLAGILAGIMDSPKPVVARVAGHCVGGGVGLAAACDISVADDAARFGFTEVRLGVAPAIISVVCLPRLRRADALELFLSGERISAGRAAEVGLITRAVPAHELDAEVAAIVARLVLGGPSALAAAKRLVYEVPDIERAEAFARTTQQSRSLFASAEAAEGIAAYREKRPPSWVSPRSPDHPPDRPPPA
jgi:methylglutaconyl-CoA hydratase